MKTNTLSLIMTLLLLSSACGNRAKESNKAVEPEENKTTETPLTEISPVETPVVENTRFPDDAEITFRSERSGSYRNPSCWFDDMLLHIDESEYREVFNMYKNRVDTTNKIQAVNGVFSVPLKDGATKKLINNTDMSGDASMEYEYAGYIPSLNYYKFIRSAYAGTGFSLISSKTGEEFLFDSDPLFSPNMEYCVTAGIEAEGVDRNSFIHVYGATETGFDYLFGLWSVGILIDEACWFHNTSLYLKTYENKENEPEGDIIEYQYFKVDLSKIKDYNLKVDESWYGEYEFATNASEEDDWHESGAYSIVIKPDSCFFTGTGYQLYFEDLCTTEERGADVIILYFYKLLDGSSMHNEEPYLGTLFRKDGKYYFNSPALNSESVYNVDIEIKKTK